MTEPTPAADAVSVAMGTFDGERFIEEQLRSLASQTLLPSELVVCDDGSSDGTVAIVEQFAAGAPFPVRVARNATRLGFAENFLHAATLCRGPLVAFCDQDDVWLPDKLALAVAALEDPEVQAVAHAATVVDDSLRPLGRRMPGDHDVRLLAARRFVPWVSAPGFTVVFRRHLLDVCGIAPRPGDPRAPGPMAHDTWVMFLAGAFGRTAALQAELALYRQHPNNVAGVRAPRYVPDASDYDRQASLADEYARELRRIADSAPAAAFRGHLLRTADAWVMVAADNRTRAALYATPTRGGRVRRLAAAVGRGHYFRRTPGALGARSLVKDSVVAIRPGHGTAPSASS